MTLDPNLLDQAYHLFVEEALELLQQIQELLVALPHDSSLTAIHKLLRTAGTIRSGAEQVNLTDIYNLARRFESICRLLWQEKTLVDGELDNLLWQAYDCLRLSLSAQMRRDREQTTDLLAQAEQVFAQLEANIARKSKSDSDLPTLHNFEENGTEWLSNQEVTQALAMLEVLLSNPQMPDFKEALRIQIEMLLSLGEVWDISEFIAIAQMSLAALQISPQTAPTIGQLALTGFKGVWEALDKKDLEIKILTLEPERQTEEKSLAQSFVGEITPSRARSQAKSAIPGAILPLTSKLIFKTAKLFIWQTGSATFIVSSESIKEILLSQKEQLASNAQEQWLHWKGEEIPIYRLSELLPYNCPHSDRPREENSVLLVLARPQQNLALEVNIERSITKPELLILPFNRAIEPPEYCYGCLLLKDDSFGAAASDRLSVAIDIEVLLSQTVDRMSRATKQASPSSTTAFVPTILVIDDSNTSRQLLALTLQKAGYKVLQARDGAEGIQQMRQNPALDLVISDIEMPKLNGFGFLQFCHNDSHLAKVPIILLSSYSSQQHRQLAMDLGAAACLSKPFDEQDFLATIGKVLGFVRTKDNLKTKERRNSL